MKGIEKGIESWATGEWKRNKEGTKEYHEFYNSIKDKINIHFIKVKKAKKEMHSDLTECIFLEFFGFFSSLVNTVDYRTSQAATF